MFTVLRPESTLSAPPEQSESVRYHINQPTSIELKERACWQAGSSWFNLLCSMMVAKCSKSFAGIYLQKLAGFESDARLRRANEKILGEYSFGKFMLVAAGFHMQPDGKVPTPVCARAGALLRRVASSSPRAVLGISEQTEAELKKRQHFKAKLGRRW